MSDLTKTVNDDDVAREAQRRLRDRADRLVRMCDLAAPHFLLKNEVELINQAMNELLGKR